MPGVLQMKASLQVRMLLDFVGKPAGPQAPKLNPILGAIGTDLTLLDKTWSQMATHNLVSDICRHIDKLAAALPAKEKVQAEATAKTLRKLIQQPSPNQARYDNIACFGYRIKTTGPAFSGQVDDWADMQTRVNDMIAAIKAAYALADSNGGHNGDNKMLKVFMAPEFYFRGRNGAYDLGVINGEEAYTPEKGNLPRVDRKPGLSELIRAEIGKPIYKNWLFVLGTAIGATRYSETVCKVCGSPVKWVKDPQNPTKTKAVCSVTPSHVDTKEKSTGARIDNVAIVVKEGTTYTFSKELISHVDFITSPTQKDKVTVGTEQLDVLKRTQPSNYKSADHVPSKFTDERMGGAVFTCDGINFGLEICLDHAATAASAASGRLDHAGNIQVQLIPSGGMSIGKLSTVTGGIVFNVDGATPHVEVAVTRPNGATKQVDLTHLHDSNFITSVTYDGGAAPRALGKDWFYTPANTFWTQPPVSTHAHGGSVFMFGPYPIPAI